MNMHKMAVSAVMGLVALVSASNASAADVIDQNANTNNSVMASLGMPFLAQSFQQGASNISGAGVFLSDGIGSSGSVDISLWTDLPTDGGTQIASGTTTGTAGAWADVFWSPVATVTGTTYFLVFSGDSSLSIDGDSTNGYGSGNVFGGYFAFGSFPDYDFTFRTYAYQNTAPIPEPETYAMMLAGLGLLGLARRRKQKAA